MSETPAEAWARCRPFIDGAFRRFGEGTIADAERAIEAGSAWFWPGENAAAVLQKASECHFWLAGGDLREILAKVPDVEAWARGQGCDRMTIIGRPGWERVLAAQGYRPVNMLVKGL